MVFENAFTASFQPLLYNKGIITESGLQNIADKKQKSTEINTQVCPLGVPASSRNSIIFTKMQIEEDYQKEGTYICTQFHSLVQ